MRREKTKNKSKLDIEEEEITPTELQELIESECKDIRGDIKEILEELRAVKNKSTDKKDSAPAAGSRNVIEMSGSTSLR